MTSHAPKGEEELHYSALKPCDVTQLGCLHLYEHTYVYLLWFSQGVPVGLIHHHIYLRVSIDGGRGIPGFQALPTHFSDQRRVRKKIRSHQFVVFFVDFFLIGDAGGGKELSPTRL